MLEISVDFAHPLKKMVFKKFQQIKFFIQRNIYNILTVFATED